MRNIRTRPTGRGLLAGLVTAGLLVGLAACTSAKDDSGSTNDVNYCVQGNALHLMGVDPTGESTDDLVATK